jgi:hypothetical protein
MRLNELTGKEVNDGVKETPGGTVLTGAGIDFAQLLMIRSALRLQSRGMRLSSKVPQGTTLARKLLGFRGNKESLLRQVNELIERIQAERKGE